MKIVGVGCGPGMITLNAIEAISSAKRIYGSERSIELVSCYISGHCEVHAIEDYKKLKEIEDDSVVLSTGDPMLAGLGYLGGEIIPGISSMQVAFARLGLPLKNAVVVSAHGGNHRNAADEAVEWLKHGKIVFFLADPAFDVSLFREAGHYIDRDCTIAVCEHLGYHDERIATGTIMNPPPVTSDLFSLVIGMWKGVK